MRSLLPVLAVFLPISQTMGAEPPLRSAVEAPVSVLRYALDTEPDAEGNTPLLRWSAAAARDPKAARLLEPLIVWQLQEGASPLSENAQGCNALFYLHAMPAFLARLQQAKLLPPVLALRLPREEAALQRYISLRAAQVALAPAEGSLRYLSTQYGLPAYNRARALLRHYLALDTLRRVPPRGLADTLAFLRMADAERAYAFIEGLNLWQHGEHFLEEVPAQLLEELRAQHWRVAPGKLRQALNKLATMLPASRDEMIDCYAAAPMTALLEMLVDQEGERALPDLLHYAQSYDPELVQACLRLQLRLRGITPPDELAPPADEEQRALRAALLTDAALHRGCVGDWDPVLLPDAIRALRTHQLPQHAALLESLTNEQGKLCVTEEGLPLLRARYDALQEESPRSVILRALLRRDDETKRAPAETAPREQP
ncbi:MAG: hypothetical protein ACI4PZ_03390 [Akkermansia sp.]